MRKDSNVAFNAAFDREDVDVVMLDPKAKVLNLSESSLHKHAAVDDAADAPLIAAVREQAEAIKNMTAMMNQLLAMNTGGYDAIKTEDRLVVTVSDGGTRGFTLDFTRVTEE